MELLVQLELGLATNYLVTSTGCGGYDNDEDGDVDIN